VTLTYDLLTLAMSGELNFACPVHVPIFSILQLSFPELGKCVTQSDHILHSPSPGTVIAHAPCHVTYHRGQKWLTFLKSLNQIYLFTLSLLRCYDEDEAML